MKSLFLGTIAATTIGIGAALAQSAADPAAKNATPAASATPMTSASPAASATPMTANNADSGSFIDKQQAGLVRAPKLVGVAVYDNNNKNVGKVADLLLDKDGTVKAVVIGVGGFLGIGTKDVAVPYSAIQWQTERRTVATNDTAAPGNATTGTTTNGTNAAPGAKTATKTIDPAETEAYQGYPDRAVIQLSQDQLKAAPEFKYASNPATTNADTTATTPAPAKTPAQ